jgi:glycosyltransferase involved in cell wall biosynthesis
MSPHIAVLGQANSVHLQRWAVALHERGRKVTVITQQAAEALPLPPGVALHALPWRGAAGYFLNALHLRKWLHAHSPDLLHAHYASGYGSTAMLAGWHPTALSVWGSDVYDFPAESALKGWLIRRNLRFADALASTSHAMAAHVRQLWPGAGEIAITPFGVDLQMFAPAPRPRPGVTLGTVKTLDYKYGVDTLLHAFAALRLQRPDLALQLIIVGDGPQREALHGLAAELGLGSTVQWVGAVPHAQVPRWLNRMDIYVAASRLDSESFGVAVVEAMACGVTVVVSDAGGLPEVVEHGVSGIVVPRDQPQALAAQLAALVNDLPLRQRLAAQGLARARAVYAWSSCVVRMLQFQDRVIDTWKSGAGRA